MPELPEVETIRRVIAPQICGAAISAVSLFSPAVIAHPQAEAFAAALKGQRITAVDRRGKYLIFRLQNGGRVLLHLRMTGCLLVTPSDWPCEKHTHVVFDLDNGRALRFSDLRRFGRFWYFEQAEEDAISGLSKLGVEPFDPALTGAYLAARLSKSRRCIKECLLDQTVVAGIGNIYADETLFRAGIRPQTPACALSEAQWALLAREIPQMIAFAIEKNAISAEDYLQTRGQDYRNTPFLQVYGHGKEPCPRCGQTLIKATVGGRGTVWCATCQR